VEEGSTSAVNLQSERVRVREVTLDDADAAFEWGSDRDWFRYLPYEPVSTIEEERAWILGFVEAARTRPRLDYQLAIEPVEGGPIIGMVHLRVTSLHHRSGELGFGVGRRSWGAGIALEAARLVLRFGFEELRLHRITAGHHPDNAQSRRVIEKLGMTREGRLRENLIAHGQWRDSIVYSMLEGEWTGST
jgi:ribosomal-protein-alanine N-acetyltransferase